MSARIYQPAKNAMQSGTARTRDWVLEFVPQKPPVRDPLMGWTGAAETASQVRLRFTSLEAAQAYARANGLAYQVIKPNKRKAQAKAYADNFKHDRIGAWTH